MNHQMILTIMFEAYPNAKLRETTAATYLSLLSDIPATDLEVVVKQLIADNGDFVPSISAIRKKWHELTHELDHPPAPEAWGLVLDQVRRVGYMGRPEFDDEVVAQTVRYMGWREICMSENMSIIRAQFERMYTATLERKQTYDHLLPGVREAVSHRRLAGPQHIGGLLEVDE